VDQNEKPVEDRRSKAKLRNENALLASGRSMAGSRLSRANRPIDADWSARKQASPISNLICKLVGNNTRKILNKRAYDLVMRVSALLFALVPISLVAQTSLQSKVATIAQGAQGTVSVSCLLPGTRLNCDLNPHNHAPMQSMYKYPLALTVLHLAEIGKLFPNQQPGKPIDVILDRTVRFLPEDIIPHAYSPLQDRYPNANVDVPLRELIRLAVGESDNGAEEVLLRIIGGPSVVQSYIRSLGISAFQLLDSERDLDHDESLQYRDWIEPAAAVQLLERLRNNPPISPAANAFLIQTLTNSVTGPHRLRAGLPPGTVLAHKTGSSGTHGGITAVTNDIGLITLPDGRKLAIAVFVTNSRADEDTREGVIARIGEAAYKEAITTK
jgi:beta-lactamase class A